MTTSCRTETVTMSTEGDKITFLSCFFVAINFVYMFFLSLGPALFDKVAETQAKWTTTTSVNKPLIDSDLPTATDNSKPLSDSAILTGIREPLSNSAVPSRAGEPLSESAVPSGVSEPLSDSAMPSGACEPQSDFNMPSGAREPLSDSAIASL